MSTMDMRQFTVPKVWTHASFRDDLLDMCNDEFMRTILQYQKTEYYKVLQMYGDFEGVWKANQSLEMANRSAVPTQVYVDHTRSHRCPISELHDQNSHGCSTIHVCSTIQA